jgi:hypothetical protein
MRSDLASHSRVNAASRLPDQTRPSPRRVSSSIAQHSRPKQSSPHILLFVYFSAQSVVIFGRALLATLPSCALTSTFPSRTFFYLFVRPVPPIPCVVCYCAPSKPSRTFVCLFLAACFRVLPLRSPSSPCPFPSQPTSTSVQHPAHCFVYCVVLHGGAPRRIIMHRIACQRIAMFAHPIQPKVQQSTIDQSPVQHPAHSFVLFPPRPATRRPALQSNPPHTLFCLLSVLCVVIRAIAIHATPACCMPHRTAHSFVYCVALFRFAARTSRFAIYRKPSRYAQPDLVLRKHPRRLARPSGVWSCKPSRTLFAYFHATRSCAISFAPKQSLPVCSASSRTFFCLLFFPCSVPRFCIVVFDAQLFATQPQRLLAPPRPPQTKPHTMIPLKTKLAAALLILDKVPHEEAQLMTVEEILREWEWDHYPIRKADGGSDHPSNIVPRHKADHREKTAKIDAPAMAKDRRIEKRWRPFMNAIATGQKPPKRMSRWYRHK